MGEAPVGATAPTLLLVEDNPGDVRLTREAVDGSEYGTSLHVVRDGAEATTYLDRCGEDGTPVPDLVLLDLNLPRKSGEELLGAFRADPAFGEVPIVVFTGSDDAEDAARAYDRSANAVVTKPVAPEEYIHRVRRVEAFWLRSSGRPFTPEVTDCGC